VIVRRTQARAGEPRVAPRFRLIFIAPALALIALVAWALASPMGASPDDDFHLVSTWCANAAKTADCEPGTSANSRVVPESLVKAPCFAHKTTVSGACQNKFSLSPKPDDLTTRGNFDHSYPPVFYATMNLFVGSNILVSVFLIRLVNIILFVGLTVALFVLLPRDRRPTLVWSWVITTVPLGLFLIASNNPSAWAIIGIGTAWLALLGYYETAGRRKILLGILFAIASVMAAGSRGDSAIYSVIGIGVVLFLVFTPTKKFLLNAILPAVLAVVSVLFFLSARQTLSGVNGFSGTAGISNSAADAAVSAGPVNPLGLLFSNIVQAPSLWGGIFGQSWGLGWIDTPVPALTGLGGIACFVAVVFVGLRRLSFRKGLAVAGVGVVLWLLPVYVLTRGSDPVGQQVQPRYLLPLIVLFAGLAVMSARGIVPFRLGRAQWIVIAATLSVGQCLALYFTMRRFVNGNEPGGFNLDQAEKWWWAIPFPPMLVFAIGSLAYAALIVVLLRDLNRRPAIGTPVPADEAAVAA
jgi:hypothetical protein